MQRSVAALAAGVIAAGAGATVAFAGASPAVSTGEATSKAPTSAELHGTVNPEGTHTTFEFNWGLTNGYGASSAPKSAGDGSTAIAVAASASDLIPGTLYHYRLLAFSKSGTSVGRDRTFRTAGHPPPGAATGPATAIGPNTATLTGTITPNGADTSWTFQYGTTAAYGLQTQGSIVSKTSPTTTVSSTLTGLAPLTLFHYRLIATHSNSLTPGLDATFLTEPSRPEPSRLAARTRPHRARRHPFVFTTFGALAGPSNIPAQYACTGNVLIRYVFRHHVVGATLATVQPNCTYSGTVAFAHRVGPRKQRRHQECFREVVRFLGNGYLAAHNRIVQVRLG